MVLDHGQNACYNADVGYFGVMAVLHADYYSLLEVSRLATSEEIKQSYRRLVRKWHPDLNPGLSDAEERLKKLNEAYRVLREPQFRRNYDRMVFARLAAHSSRNVPVNIPRTVRERRRRVFAPVLASVLALSLLAAVGLAVHEPMCLPEEWRTRASYQEDGVLSRRVTLSAEELEAAYRSSAYYWEKELQIVPAESLAQYNLATAYSQLAGLAESRGDLDLAERYGNAARRVMPSQVRVDPTSGQVNKG